MAIFNYAKTYSEVSSYLSATKGTTGDYIKFIITGDSHIISHGVDFTPWSTDETYGKGTGKYWNIKYLPIDDYTTSSDNGLWTSKTIADKISAITGTIADGMHFRGTLSTDDNTKYSVNGGTADAFPTGVVGDTYRIAKSGTYKGNTCEAGDLLICVTAKTNDTEEAWTVAQTNINGIVYHKINNVFRGFYSNDTDTFTIYAPTKAGTEGQLLISNGGTRIPTWTNQSDITAGKVQSSLKLDTNTGLYWDSGSSYNGSAEATIRMHLASYDNFGTIKGDSDTVTINNGILSLTSKNILNALDLDSIASVNTWRPVKKYGPSGWEELLGIGPDTNSSLGFKSGSGTTIQTYTDTDNKVSYVTFNVNTGYTTDTTDTTNRKYAVQVDTSTSGTNANQLYVNVPWVAYGVVSTTANGLAPQLKETEGSINSVNYKVLCYDSETNPVWKKLPSNAFLNTWRTITWGGTNINNNPLTVTGSGHTKVSANATTGAAVISSTWRPISIDNTSIGDSTSLNIVGSNKTSVSYNNGTATISSTWRDIQIGGTSIENQALNFMPTGSIYVVKNDMNTSNENTFDVGFDIAWYNISESKYEYE